jgi:integrase
LKILQNSHLVFVKIRLDPGQTFRMISVWNGGDPMARSKTDVKINNRSNRANLAPKPEPYWSVLEAGRAVGYRKSANGAGTWIVRVYDPAQKPTKRYHSLGSADDLAEPDGEKVLNWAQAQTKAREWAEVCDLEAAQIAAGETVHRGPYTVANAIDDYLEDGRRRGMKSIPRTECAARVHIIPELGDVDVAKLTRGRIEKWLQALANSPRRVRTPMAQSRDGEPLKKRHRSNKELAEAEKKPAPAPPATDEEKRARKDSANRVLTILKAALNHALDRRRVRGGEAWREVKPYRGTTSARIRFLTLPEQVRIVNACPADFRSLVQGALFTGARYGELAKIQVRDFNPEAGTVFVAESKSGKPRHIILTQEGQDWFSSITAGKSPDELVFTRSAVKRRGRSGKMEKPDAWAGNDQAHLMRAACKAAGLERLSFHELRHTAASTWLNAGLDLLLVARQLGHADTRMVEQHYGHLCPDAAAKRFRELAPTLGIAGPAKVAALKIESA